MVVVVVVVVVVVMMMMMTHIKGYFVTIHASFI
jgi:hypothetical protein